MRPAPLALLITSAALGQTCTPSWQGFAAGGEVRALYSDVVGGQLLVGGQFPGSIARFTGAGLERPWGGLEDSYGVEGITRHDDGTGSTIYITGFPNVPMSGGWSVNYARLTEGRFRSFGPPNGPNAWTGPAVSYDLGRGPRFLTSGGFGYPCDYVSQWSGSAWECLAGGLGSVVHAAAVYDDGRGAALYCVGSLIINDLPFSEGIGVGRWNGTAWESVGGGIRDGYATSCRVHDDGSGPELVMGGQFSRLGGAAGFPLVNAANIAKWNGARWAPLGGGTNRIVRALAPFDDGSGLKLYAAGDFTAAGGAAASRLARWDGAAWSRCPAGGLPAGTVNAMTVHDPDGVGPSPSQLFLAGAFSVVGDGPTPAGNLAALHRAPSADVNGDGFTDFFDYDVFVSAFEAGGPAADFNRDGFTDFFDYDAFVGVFEAGC